MGADVFIDSKVATERVREALQGPVIRVLAEGVPEIRRMSQVKAYELLLGDISLLERCFTYFRANRQRFEAILVDGERRPVGDDGALLSCGRTLNEVIAMVVRSAASRYFRKHLDDGSGQPAAAPVPAKGGGIATLLGPLLGRGSAAPRQPLRSKAQELYLAIREYLLYEWQVPLVPTYSGLTPGEVVTLGPRIADLRSADAILVAAGRPPPKSDAVPPPADAPLADVIDEPEKFDLASLLTEDGRRLEVETLVDVLQDAEVVAVGDNGEQPAHIKSALKAVGRDLLRVLVEDLGLDKRRLAVCLVRAQAAMPRSAFEQLVRGSASSPATARFVAAAMKAGIGPGSTLPDCAGFITRLYSRQ